MLMSTPVLNHAAISMTFVTTHATLIAQNVTTASKHACVTHVT